MLEHLFFAGTTLYFSNVEQSAASVEGPFWKGPFAGIKFKEFYKFFAKIKGKTSQFWRFIKINTSLFSILVKKALIFKEKVNFNSNYF